MGFQPLSDFDYELKLLRRHVPDIFCGGNVLDVGCYDGSFGAALKQAGMNYIGIEPNKEMAIKGIRSGLNIVDERFEFNGLIETIRDIKIISFRECLYYIPDTEQTFELIDSILKLGGYIYIKSVNASSIYFHGSKTPALRCGEGFTRLYTRKEMNELLIQHGYEIIYSGYYPHNVFSTAGLQGCDTVPLKAVGRMLRPLTEWLEIADRYLIIAKKVLSSCRLFEGGVKCRLLHSYRII